jgi:polyhydroxybutyrate depolymerase
VGVRSPGNRRGATLLAATLAVVVLVAACGSTKTNDGASGIGAPAIETTPETTPAALAAVPTAVSTAPARPSAGCQNAMPPSAHGPGAPTGTVMPDQKITVDGVEHTYRLFTPPAGADGTPRPVVLNLHGLTSNIAQQVAVSQFEPLAAIEGFIVVTPQGLGTPTKWGFDNTPQNADLPFFNALLDQIEAQQCVDVARVYSTGISNGGMMSTTLVCQMGDRIAAVGLVSGIREPDNCTPPDRPKPLIVFWGTKDVVLPFFGGEGPGLTGARPMVAPTAPPADLQGFAPVEQVVGEWASHDGCNAEPTVFPSGVKVEERVFTGCTADVQIRFFVVSDGGHDWPGSKLLIGLNKPDDPYATSLGNTTDQIDATALIWKFFRGYALTG